MLLETVSLADLRADPNNPRTDFGDLEALAASFELNTINPGEPLNPPVVVRDGNVLRIVDGERRYRAMTKANRKSCNVIVCDDMDQANALVAMLATDDKQQLSATERSRGVQQMLLLGVDEKVVERVGRIERGSGKRVRLGAARAGDDAQQMKLEQLIAIGEAEERGDDEAADAIAENLNSWEWTANRYQRFRENQAAYERIAAYCADRRIELHQKAPKGFVCQNSALYISDDADWVYDWIAQEAALGRTIVFESPKIDAYSLSAYSYAAPTGLSEQEAEERSSFNKAKAAMTASKKRRAQWVAERLAKPEELEHTIAFFATDAMRSRFDMQHFCDRAGIEDTSEIPASACAQTVVEHWERADGMIQKELQMIHSRTWERSEYTVEGARSCALRFRAFLHALVDDGYMPDEAELDLDESCGAIIEAATLAIGEDE